MTDTPLRPPTLTTPPRDTLLERYGHTLDAPDLTEDQRVQLLTALWHLMALCVDFGFAAKPGDKHSAKCAIGLDDVVDYVVSGGDCSSANSPPTNNKKETP